ncbi:poly-gamma-glutamate biosynthesis protein PgsC [Sinanaerobacter chloroacetimidivorans]|uniref:Poly-gamma-glutamate biosynthesis protein PgsC n=1 Tax=Sinanaerobacter chloroacetimidivorans TaxID=2818044 RepID=A0A8J7W820_9FIRM|nr:poly-gamma-glutamate biosynthesis protein PgsC [Sinanaerobacter chloroacetimidivorans]MBR0600575.1 poly-gamma-glutamate biosynthesis protein PgsC [Sinanaerobacter chloroacetimidivorans]
MQLTNIDTVILLGVILSLLFTEITGVLPAGLVVPGYLALLLEQPQSIFLTFLISILTYIIVSFGVSKITILYGKRKFASMITVAIVLQYLIKIMIPFQFVDVAGLAAVGIIVPGLLANTIQRQGLTTTFLSTGLLTALTYGCVILLQIQI